jgi:D-amino-acid dehydrogenase
MLLRLKAIPSLIGWGSRFLFNSMPARFEANSAKNARLAKYSLDSTRDLCASAGIDCGFSVSGSLRIFHNPSALGRAHHRADWLKNWGVRSMILDARETVTREPALHAIESSIAGALYYPDDATGNAYSFCVAIAGALQRHKACLRFGSTVTGWNCSRDQIIAVQTRSGEVSGDIFVLAAGNGSKLLGRLIGLRIPVCPVKGYSLTIPYIRGEPKLPVIDDDLHAAVVPIGDLLRVVGTAEFAGYDTSIPKPRIDNLLRLLSAMYPEVGIQSDLMQIWAGLRPMCADGVPIIGPSTYRNLFINTGHGHLGWTMAVGSGRALAELITETKSSIDLSDYAIQRF